MSAMAVMAAPTPVDEAALSSTELVQAFDRVFVGRRDVYAEGFQDPNKPQKFRYRTVHEPLTLDRLRAHLRGEVCLGVYPLVDGEVGWFAVDFDAPTDASGAQIAEPFPAALEAGRKQVQAFARVGLRCYIERSRSGQGVHVWGFLDEMMDAGTVRTALKPLLTDHDVFDSRDRMYPVQPSTATLKEGLGNLIALPYYGAAWKLHNSCMLDDAGQPIPPRDFLTNVRTTTCAVLRDLVERAPKPRPAPGVATGPGVPPATVLRPVVPFAGALKLISAYGCAFMRHCWQDRKTLKEPDWYAAIQQATALRYGREFAHAISADHPGYDPATVDAKYDHALENPPVGCQYIRENFPQSVCATCPVKAPYHMAKQSILQLVSSADEPMVNLAYLDEHLELIHRLAAGEQVGLRTQFKGLDEYMRFRNSELVVVGGQPSSGKTQWAIDCAYRLAHDGIPVFFFSAETGREAFADRLLSRVAEIDSYALRNERAAGPLTPDEWARLGTAKKAVQDLPIFLDFTSLTAEQVLAQIEGALLTHGLPLDSRYVVFYDYIQHGAKITGDDSEYDRITRLSSEFKFIAKIIDRPVVILSQLRRETEGDDKPDLTWFKGSGRIESDANTALIITGPRSSAPVVERTVTIVKQKEGLASVKVTFRVQQAIGRWDSEATGMAPDRGPALGGSLGAQESR